MSDVAAPLPRIPRWFIAALVLLSILLIVLGIVRSNRSTLRGDEVVTLFWNREKLGIGSMLWGGARPQVSPAPLYYIVGRVVDEAKARLDYLGLRYSGYFRLPSVLFTAGLGAAAAWLIALRLRRQEAPVSPVAYFLVLCGVAVYWFQPKVFSFACIDRPYGLWNGLWLLVLAWMLGRPDSRLGLGILLCLMASTATAACFQILACGIALAVVRRLEGRAVKDILIEGARLFSAPALIGTYYALQTDPVESENRIRVVEMLRDQLRFWLVTNLQAWVAAGVSCALVFSRPGLRTYRLPVLAFTTLLLLVPLIYFLAQSMGFSSPSRQYIWTTTAIPLALFLAALSLTDLSFWKPAPKVAVVIAAGLVVGFSIAAFLRAPARNDSRRLACLEPGSSLHDQLLHERPKFLRYPTAMGQIETDNLLLLTEWIRLRYRDLPIGDFEIPIRDENGRLISDPIVEPNHLPADWSRLRTGF